ncbi:carbon-nitrogen hydrolase family protein [Leptobacterium flavescens]|uniref:carbon-nitrogen hydrolase family protein n=1 Tax=Leptobacterium flavescens TaxID=472055 RepID=UPI00293BBD9F|nr:carbon-nitrogen hydrolase family protein [Leptobacterium flavescens]
MEKTNLNHIKVAVVQATPVFFDLEATLLKAENIIKEQASKGCNLILFPESFIPGYPRGFSFEAVVGKRDDEGRDLYLEYWKHSLEVGSEAFLKLEKTIKESGAYVVMGATEKEAGNGSLYCSMLYFSPEKGYLGNHRKIKPTGVERLIWAEASGESLITVDSKIGRLGGLICWENYMPMARASMYRQGVQLYLAPTADARPTWTSTMQHIACEGRCFVLAANQYFRKEDYPEKYRKYVSNEANDMCRGGSLIVSPMGEVIAGPLYDEEGVLTATLNLEDLIKSKLDFDVIGHYNRSDIFKLEVKDQPDPINENAVKENKTN